jgi:SRSO17 transposase
VLDLSIQELVDVLASRWEIESFFFEYEQDLLGSDHYQLQPIGSM